jgi:FK506-binding nuclear protein
MSHILTCLRGRFEEIAKEAPRPNKKRARESDLPSTEETPSATENLSKAQKKKLNKKLKTENGAGVPVESSSVASVTPVAEKKEEKKEKKDKKEKKEKAPAPVKELPGGLKVKDAKAGSGKVAKKGK